MTIGISLIASNMFAGNYCSRIVVKYKLDTIRSTPSWSSVDLTLPAGATLDSIYGGFKRAGYSGASLSYEAWSVGATHDTSLLNKTTSFYGTYTGPYGAWIKTDAYNVIGKAGSYIRFSITTSNGMTMDSALIAYSFPTPATPTITQNVNVLTSSIATSYQWYLNGNMMKGRTSDTINASVSGQYSVQITNTNGCTNTSAPFTFVFTGLCSQQIVKYTLDTIGKGLQWSLVDLALPAGAQLDSIFGGFQRPGYSGSALSYSAWSVGTTNDTNLLNKTTTFYGSYTGPYGAWINTDSYKVIGKTGSFVRFSITTNNGMIMDSALIAWSFPKPIATITPSATSVCQGNNITLTANTGSSLTYSWSSSNTTNQISVSATGTYSLTVTNSNNCSNTASQTVTVNPLPPIPTIARSTAFLSSSSSTGNQWYLNGNILSGRTNDTLNLGTFGNYSVEVTNGNGCTATSTPYSDTSNVLNYCLPVYANGCSGGNGQRISNVTFDSINNSSNCSDDINSYINYLSSSFHTTVGEGNSYNISVTSTSNYVCGWIDYNQNGNFGDAGESIFVSGSSFTGSIAIPANATIGQTRMRIMCSNDLIGASDYCNNSLAKGESQDYTITISNSITTGIPNGSLQNGLSIFPNPNSGQTTIKYNLTTNSLVVIELYNLLGSKEKSILNSNQQAGTFQTTIDMGDLNNGIYLLKSTMNGEISTQRIILVK